MATSNLIITSNDSLTVDMRADTLSPQESVVRVAQYFNRLAAGCGNASVDMQVDETGGVAATGTVTFASLANNDTVTIGGIVFTAKTSGATGSAQFNLGASDTAAAAAAVVKINAHTSLTSVCSATSSAEVITVSCVKKTVLGNYVSLAISAHGSVSGALLTGGVNPTSKVMHVGL